MPFSGERRVTEHDIHSSVHFAQYRLFELENSLDDIYSECLRITMLAFLATTFQLSGARIRYKYAAKKLRELCMAVHASTHTSRELMFWILMIGALAFFEHDDQWLREKWKLDVLPLTKDLQWDQAEQILMQYVWISSCHSNAGQRIFDEISRSVRKS